jgi:hypothetical protein
MHCSVLAPHLASSVTTPRVPAPAPGPAALATLAAPTASAAVPMRTRNGHFLLPRHAYASTCIRNNTSEAAMKTKTPSCQAE